MSLPIVDSHIHFWDPERFTYAWHEHVPAIATPHFPKRLQEEAADVDLQGIIFVEADCAPEQREDEVAWVSQLASSESRIQAIVASAPIEEGPDTVRPYLARLLQYPLVRGIRRLIQSEGPGFCTQPDFVAAVQLLPEFDLRFDICIQHHQMHDAIGLVEQCPDVQFVLDHFGKPNVRDEQLDPWREDLRALAEFPNVFCKLSGLATEADPENWTREQLRPYIDYAIETFGVDRVFYGGDWPVAKLAIAYPTWIETLLWATEGLSDTDRRMIFAGNALRFYGIAGLF